jgi:hypothetical protein
MLLVLVVKMKCNCFCFLNDLNENQNNLIFSSLAFNVSQRRKGVHEQLVIYNRKKIYVNIYNILITFRKERPEFSEFLDVDRHDTACTQIFSKLLQISKRDAPTIKHQSKDYCVQTFAVTSELRFGNRLNQYAAFYTRLLPPYLLPRGVQVSEVLTCFHAVCEHPVSITT